MLVASRSSFLSPGVYAAQPIYALALRTVFRIGYADPHMSKREDFAHILSLFIALKQCRAKKGRLKHPSRT
jgi:hypothetical protein